MASPESRKRRNFILERSLGRSINQALIDPELHDAMVADAASDPADQLVTQEFLRVLDGVRSAHQSETTLGMYFSTDDVLIIPGLFGSQLADLGNASSLLWPDVSPGGSAKSLRRLGLRDAGAGKLEKDRTPGVEVRAVGPVPLIYSGLVFELQARRYEVYVVPYDWRMNLDFSARLLATMIRERSQRRFRPLHLIAHAEGSLVARKAIQLLGSEVSRNLVSSLTLLAPTSGGSFTAAWALGGQFDRIESFRRFGITASKSILPTVQTWSSLYQVLPCRKRSVVRIAGDRSLQVVTSESGWRGGRVQLLDDPVLAWLRRTPRFNRPEYWVTGIDEDKLKALYGWPESIDTGFFSDRTTIILGDEPEGVGHGQTAGGVQFTKGRLVEVARAATQGDGVLPDALALLPGVTRVYRARGGGHWLLPTRRSVIAAVRELLAGRSPRIEPARGSGRARQTARHATGDTIGVLGVAYLRETDDDTTIPAPSAAAMPSKTMVGLSTKAANSRRPVSPPGVVTAATSASQMPELEREVSPPQSRRLRVFSFDPLLATDLDALGTDTIVLDLPWDFSDGDGLRPGPVGEYLEVVDYDPASRCFYPPVDLNHPHLLAQDGLPVSEGDPRFHQQMVYAVAMSTIAKFEEALGRVALWAPMLRRDSRGQVIPSRTPGDEYVQRLRVYPHAFRQANAYYSPEKKALLFGYFPADGSDVGRNLPGGMVFSCLSFDIIAHETTHALLDGLHRYLTEPSNPDVYAFHEAFADIVALFQHFSQPAVLWHQLARSKGDLSKESLLGALAVQFGEALGKHGALRGYLGHYDPQTRKWTPKVPDPRAITQVFEPHERGAILVAALFRAFTNIYENRVRDLRRIASGGTGELPEGDLHPDLVTRLAEEAARAAGHVLTMCIRALDYIPPIDLTFGEYLRALITADYDLVRNDDRRYRVSFLSAFRDWGIYPGDVRSLSVDNLLWQPLPIDALRDTRDFFVDARLEGWKLRSDRRDSYLQMREFSLRFNSWLREIQRSWDRSHPNGVAEWAWPLGLSLGRKAPRSILRREDDDLPIFEVHSLRPSRRIGPDGQQRTFAVVELVQRRLAYFDPVVQNRVDEHGPVLYPSDLSASAGSTAGRARRRRGALPPRPDFYFRGGSTLIIDPETGEIRYGIRKSVLSKRRLDREREFRQGAYGDRVGGIYLADDRAGRGNPFAFLHSAY